MAGRKTIEEMTPDELIARARASADRDRKRAKRYRDRKRASGEVRVSMYVPAAAAEHVRAAMRRALEEWDAGREGGPPPPSTSARVVDAPAPKPEPRDDAVYMRLDFPTTVAVVPIREELERRGFLFIAIHNCWCGLAGEEATRALVGPCQGAIDVIDSESILAQAWARQKGR